MGRKKWAGRIKRAILKMKVEGKTEEEDQEERVKEGNSEKKREADKSTNR